MTTDSEPMAYIARAACGYIKMATVDQPGRAKHIAQHVAECIRDGLTIERVTVAYVRQHGFGDCAVCTPASQERLPL